MYFPSFFSKNIFDNEEAEAEAEGVLLYLSVRFKKEFQVKIPQSNTIWSICLDTWNLCYHHIDGDKYLLQLLSEVLWTSGQS